MFRKTVLDSGITVVTENHEHQRAVCVGAFILTGTRDEDSKHIGITHFVEHMIFKGTKNRNASEISRSLECVGGELNAYTTREYTCIHALSLKEDLNLDIDVIGDLICNARFSPLEFEREKKVILQEVGMTEDTPEEFIFDLFFERIYGKSSLGWPILGSAKSLDQIARGDLIKYYKEGYLKGNIIVAAAGCLDHEEVVAGVKRAFKLKKKSLNKMERKVPEWITTREVVQKEGEQTHIVVGFEGLSYVEPRRFDSFVLNAWLGGGMSSKLYQSIREKKGLAYTVYSNLT